MKRSYGIERDGDHVRIVRARRRGRRLSTEEVWSGIPSQARDEWDAVAGTVRWEVGERLAAAVAHVDTPQAVLRRLQTPIRSRRKTARVLPSLLDVQLPFPLESCGYAMMDIRRGEDGCSGLVMAARLDSIDRRVEDLRAWGLDAVCVEHEALALHTAVAECIGPRPAWVLWAGETRTVLACLDAAAPRLAHGAPALDASGALSAEASPRVRRLLHAASAGADAAPESVVLCGPRAPADLRDPSWEALPELQDLPVIVPDQPQRVLAEGLARRGLEIPASPGNLLTGAREHILIAKTRRRADNRAAAVWFAGLLLWAGLAIGWQGFLDHKLDRTQTRLQELGSSLAGYPVQRGQEVREVRLELEEKASRRRVVQSFTQDPVARRVDRILAFAGRADLRFSSLTVQPSAVHIRGTAPDYNRPEALSALVQKMGLQATLNRGSATEEGRVPFSVRAGGGDE